jgi:hypothetical protein
VRDFREKLQEPGAGKEVAVGSIKDTPVRAVEEPKR